ncbi:hypothetical protein M1D47_24380 [Bacillus sp. R1-10]
MNRRQLTPLKVLNGAFLISLQMKALVSFEDHGQAFKSTSAFMKDQ